MGEQNIRLSKNYPTEGQKTLIRKTWPRIRLETKGGLKYYTVDGRYNLNGKTLGEKEYFKEEAVARGHADKKYRERFTDGVSSSGLSFQLRADALLASEKAKARNLSLYESVEIANKFLEEKERVDGSPLIEKALDEWVDATEEETKKKEDPLSERTLDEIEGRAELYASAFSGLRVLSISEKDVRIWFEGLKQARQTRRNILTKLSQFFLFCRRRHYIQVNPCELIDFSTRGSRMVKIFEPEEAKALLLACASHPRKVEAVTYFCLCSFAGLRPDAEAKLYKWEWLHWDTKQIEVHSTKTKDVRFVPMEEAFIRHVKLIAKKTGLVLKPGFRRQWDKIRIHAGYNVWVKEKWLQKKAKGGKEWAADVMRHTYASYWLAKYKNLAELAVNMSNSEPVIRRRYRREIPKKKEEAFWAL